MRILLSACILAMLAVDAKAVTCTEENAPPECEGSEPVLPDPPPEDPE